jgi:hypothetical protein
VAHPSCSGPLRRRGLSGHAFGAGLATLLLIAAVSVATDREIRGDGFTIRYPAGAEGRAERLRRYMPRSREAAAAWLGLPVRGAPTLHLVRDHAGMPGGGIYRSPEWAVAVADNDDRIYFRLDLVDTTPANKLELVLDHELVHQLLNHLGGERLPRWFEEGMCVAYAGSPFLEMNTTLERSAAARRLPTFEESRLLFHGNATEAAKAYAIGHEAVRFLIARHGHESMQRILKGVGRGDGFEQAFARVTHESLASFEAAWRKQVTPWLPFWLYLFVSDIGLSVIWIGAALVFFGWLRRRLRRERALRSLDAGLLDDPIE